jgi:hypothetical protein
MDTEAPSTAARAQRPRSALLIALGIVAILAFVAWRMGNRPPTAGPAPVASNPQRPTTPGQPNAPIDPSMLEVHLESLEAERPAPGDSERNPFRFQPKAAPPPPPDTAARPEVTAPTGPPPPPPPPTIPPIPLKFIGIIESPELAKKIAAFTDCRSTYQVAEGDTIAGQYRLVKLGVESAVVEYLNGKGRTTLRMGGQECVGK